MAISRMQQPRQMYGLGSIVKKAVRGVKKIVKSPIGKAALLAGGAYLGGGMMGGTGGMSNFRAFGAGIGRGIGNFRSGTAGTKMGSLSNLFRQSTKRADGTYSGQDNPFSLGKIALGGLGVASLAPLLMKGGDEDNVVDETVEQINPATQVQRAKNFYSGMGDKGVGLNFMPQKKYVSQNFYAADGGRAGYAMGGDIEEEDEIAFARSGAGQSRKQPMAFLAMGGGAANAQAEQMLMTEFVKYKNKGGDLSFEQFVKAVMQQQEQAQGMEQPMMAANGGLASMTSVPGYGTPAGTNKFGYPSGGVRVGKADGGQLVSPSNDGSRPGYAGDDGILSTIKNFPKNLKSGLEQIFSGEVGATLGGDQKSINEFMVEDMWGQTLPKETIDMIIDANKKGVDVETIISLTGADASDVTGVIDMLNMNIEQKAYGGRIGRAEGGIMDTEEAEMIDMGGQEKDYRETGGFVEMGGEERADDVPARLSKNEFVFTADAVRNAGGGDIDRGSEVMQNLMDNLEQGGQVSEDSQGLGGEEMMMSEEMIEEPNGAQAMYEQQQALQSRMI